MYRYVTHARVLDYALLGWHLAEIDLGHHSRYSVLMQWLCPCKMVEPI